ncbi:MAG: hypothetical protein AAB453_04190 [Patescibacteria group bacterium]
MLALSLQVTIVIFLLAIITGIIYWTWVFFVPFLASLTLLGAIFGIHYLEEMLT